MCGGRALAATAAVHAMLCLWHTATVLLNTTDQILRSPRANLALPFPGVAERLDAGAYLEQEPTRTANEASAWRRSGGPGREDDV